MTTNFSNDTCKDPFDAINNQIENDCQTTFNGRYGLFPARFCVKIAGTILNIDGNSNRSLIGKRIFLRTCIIENIMDTTRSLESTGNFRLKTFPGFQNKVKIQGMISLCTLDGCNQANCHASYSFKLFISLSLLVLH